MFLTYDRDRIPIPEGLCGDGEHLWSHLELVLQSPWFVVTVTREDEEMCRTSTALCMDPRHLALLEIAPNTRVDRVILVTPAYVNGSSQTRFDALTEVWECVDRTNDGDACRIYVVESGAEYCDSVLETAPVDLKRVRRIFPTKHFVS